MRRRLRETLKTTLIVVLTLSLIALTTMTWFYDPSLRETLGFGFLNDVARAFGLTSPEPDSIHFVPIRQYAEAAYPVRTVLTLNGQHTGAQYEPALVNSIYENKLIRQSLGEAMGSARGLTVQTQTEWQQALMSDGLYFEYDAPVSLPMLSLWLSVEPSQALPDVPVKWLALVWQEDAMALFFISEADGQPYRCHTALSSPDIFLSSFDLAPCRFGWEDASYARAPHVLIFDTPPAPQNASFVPGFRLDGPDIASIPEMNAFLRLLGINPSTNAHFPNSAGTTYLDNNRSCLFSAGGAISYRHTPSAEPSADAQRPADLVELSRALLSTLAPLLEQAHLSLGTVTTKGSDTTITFYYLLQGIRVQLSGGAPVTLVFRNGTLVEASIRVLRLSTELTVPDLLPMHVAYLLLESLHSDDFDLVLIYEERENGQLVPGWSKG